MCHDADYDLKQLLCATPVNSGNMIDFDNTQAGKANHMNITHKFEEASMHEHASMVVTVDSSQQPSRKRQLVDTMPNHLKQR